MGDVSQQVEDLGRNADNSDWLDRAVRIGLVAYGVVYLLIAWLALQLALGDRSGKASSTGAMHQLAQQPLGGVLVWVVAIGMFLLVALAAWSRRRPATGTRTAASGSASALVSLGKAVMYAVIGYPRLKVAINAGSTERQRLRHHRDPHELAGRAVDRRADRPRVIAYGVNLVRRAWTEKFREHLDRRGPERRRRHGLHLVRQGGLHRQGRRLPRRRRPVRLRRRHPRGQEVRRPRPRAAQGARTSRSARSCSA